MTIFQTNLEIIKIKQQAYTMYVTMTVINLQHSMDQQNDIQHASIAKNKIFAQFQK